MTVHRFFTESLDTYPSIIIDGTEAHHAIKVLRIREGELVEVFDGRGNIAFGEVASIHKRELHVTLSEQTFAPHDHDDRFYFAVALPKGDRQRSVVEKLVELGVDRLLPIHTRYSVAEIDSGNVDRLVRYAVESCKQCGRNRNMAVESGVRLSELVKTFPTLIERGFSLWILHPGGESSVQATDLLECSQTDRDDAAGGQRAMFIVGPEGGFTDEEVAQCLAAGAKPLSLGPRILRVETAVSYASILGQLYLNTGKGVQA